MKTILPSRNTYIFSKVAAQAIIGHEVDKVEVWAHVVEVFPKGRSPIFVSKRKFYEYFANSRRERGQALKAQRVANGWLVPSGRVQDRNYLVEAHRANALVPELVCNCFDYGIQFELEITQHPCCKHCYSVLDTFGYDSYRAWQEDARHRDMEDATAEEELVIA